MNFPRPAGVVEMDVGQHDPVDPLGWHALFLQRVEHPRHATARGGVDDRGTAAFDYQVHRALHRPQQVGIDGADAVGVIENALHLSPILASAVELRLP